MSIVVQFLILLALIFICAALVFIDSKLYELGKIIANNKRKGGEE